MTHDVFISYSSLDKTAADTVCSFLEQNSISCWIAPRDITPGLDFAQACGNTWVLWDWEALRMESVSPVAQSGLHDALHLTGRYDEAWESLKNEYISIGQGQAFNLDFHELGYESALNKTADALIIASESTYVSPIMISNVYILASNKEQALKFLEKAFEIRETNMPYIMMPTFDIIRDEPRFQALLKKLNLPLTLNEEK